MNYALKGNQQKRKRPEAPMETFPEQAVRSVVSGTLKMVEEGLQSIVYSGEIKPGQAVDLTQTPEGRSQIENKRVIQEIYMAEAEFETRRLKETKKEIEKRIADLITAIQKEAWAFREAASALSADSAKIIVEQKPAKPGRYHANFFEWILKLLQELRVEINKSRTWLDLFTQKKKARGYWQMFKKHGTTFAMSGERGIATSAG